MRAGRQFLPNITQLALFTSTDPSGLTQMQSCRALCSKRPILRDAKASLDKPPFPGTYVCNKAGPPREPGMVREGRRRLIPHSSPPRPLQDHIAADPCIGASYHYPCGKNAGKELEPHPNHSQTAMAHPGSGGRLLWGPLENKEKLCKLYLAT